MATNQYSLLVRIRQLVFLLSLLNEVCKTLSNLYFIMWEHGFKLTSLNGSGHSTKSCTVSISIWSIINWILWLLNCGCVCVFAPAFLYHGENTVSENVYRCLCSIFFFTCKKFPRNLRGILWKRPPPMYQPEAKGFLLLKPHVPPLCLPRNTPFLNYVLIFHFGIVSLFHTNGYR